MSKLLKSIFLFSVFLFFCSTFAFCDENITITTYYPSPYGSYNSLQVNNLGVGDVNADTAFTSADVPSGSGNVWIAGKVGIGTGATIPTESLQVVDTILVGSSTTGNGTLAAAYANLLLLPGPSGNRIDMSGCTYLSLGTNDVLSWNYEDSTSNLGYIGAGIIGTDGSFTVAGKIGIANTAPAVLLDLGKAGTTKGVMRLAGNTSGNVTIQPAAVAGTWSLTLPAAVGAAGNQLTDAAGNGIASWAAPGSLRSMKNIIGTALPAEALTRIINTKVYRFHYKPGMGTGDSDTEYVGVMADEAPWAMHYKGTIVNPVNTLGYMILGIQALSEKISTLTQKSQKQQEIIKDQQFQIDALKARLDKLEKK